MASGKPFQAIYTGNQDVLDASIVEVGEDTEPVVSAFLIGEIQAEKFLLALDVQAKERHPKANPLPGRPVMSVMRRPARPRPCADYRGHDNVKANGQSDLYIP